jgi:tetratricopeptide (TPR) repeat protein
VFQKVIVFLLLCIVIKNNYFVKASNFQDSKDSLIQDNKLNNLKYLNRKAENSSDADTIIFYGNKALQFAEENELSISRSLLALGDGFLQSGNHIKALECFTRAANAYEAENKPIGMATAFNYISNVYSAQQNYNNSISYLRRAINIYQDLDDTKRLADSKHNLAYAYYELEKYDTALIVFSEAKEKYEELGNEYEMAYCIGNSGLVLLKQKKFEEAENNFLEAIQILRKYNDEYAIIDFMVGYAKVLKHKKEFKKAINFALQSYKLAQKNNISDYKRDASYCLSELYKFSNKYDSAIYYLEIHYAVRDSIKNLQSIQQMADLRTEFEVSQKQLEVDSLNKRKTIQLIIISALIIIIILAGILISVYRKNLKRVRKFTAVLNERKNQLEKQRKELEELNGIKDKFFSIISHDLRSPINSLGGISFMIRESIENDSPNLLWKVVDYIDKTTFSLSSLLDNLLNWAMFNKEN